MSTIYKLQVTSEQIKTWRDLMGSGVVPFCPLSCAAFVAGFDPIDNPKAWYPYISTLEGTLVPISTEERLLVEEFICQVDDSLDDPEPQTFLFTLELD